MHLIYLPLELPSATGRRITRPISPAALISILCMLLHIHPKLREGLLAGTAERSRAGRTSAAAMVKAYLRYVQEASWGVVVSGGGQVVVDPTGKLAITPALDAVIVWDIKTQSIVHRLVPPGGRPGETSEVTALALASDGDTLAAGHANGTIHLWRLSDGEERTVLTGHRSAVTALHFNAAATLLASGSHDTNVVVWDVVGEAGVCRLRGHRVRHVGLEPRASRPQAALQLTPSSLALDRTRSQTSACCPGARRWRASPRTAPCGYGTSTCSTASRPLSLRAASCANPNPNPHPNPNLTPT